MSAIDKINSGRTRLPLENNLTSLIEVEPAQPAIFDKSLMTTEQLCGTYDYSRRNSQKATYLETSRTYRFSKCKVKTVGEIRNKYESLILSTVATSLELLEQNLVEKIKKRKDQLMYKDCFSPEEETIMNGKDPITRAAWVLMIKTTQQRYQYVEFESNKYCLTGSRCMKSTTHYLNGPSSNTKNNLDKTSLVRVFPKDCLLKNSLKISFKPGPRSKKPILDNSYQRFNIGKTLLVNLPTVGVEVSPVVGTQLDRSSCQYLSSYRRINDTIDEKWATFASSILVSSEVVKCGNTHTFPLKYENNSNLLLVRQDCEISSENGKPYSGESVKLDINDADKSNLEFLDNFDPENSLDRDIKSILKDMIESVWISSVQDELYKDDPDSDEPEYPNTQQYDGDIIPLHNNALEKKETKKKHCGILELKKLGMTVININDIDANHKCIPQCRLGCVDLNAKCFLRVHCRHIECMFVDYCILNSTQNIEFPLEAANIQFQATQYLSKEERKFHQTVILSNNEAIVMGAKQRDVRCKRLCNEIIDANSKKRKKLVVKLDRLPDFSLVEVWCMVHQVYRCFCKGRFQEGVPFKLSVTNVTTDEIERLWNYNPSSNYHKTEKENHKAEKITIKYPKTKKNLNSSHLRLIKKMKKMNKSWKIYPADINQYINHEKKEDFKNETNETVVNEKKRKFILNRKYQNKRDFHKEKKKNTEDRTSEICNDRDGTQDNWHKYHEKKCTDNGQSEMLTNLEDKSAINIIESPNSLWIGSTIKNNKNNIVAKNKCMKDAELPNQIKRITEIMKSGGNIYELLYESRKNMVFPLSCLSKLYLNNKCFFYVSTQPPYKLFFSMTKKYLQHFIDVKSVPQDDLNKYPSVIKRILCKSVSRIFSFIILSPKTNLKIWEIIGEINQDPNKTMSNQNNFTSQNDADNVIGKPKMEKIFNDEFTNQNEDEESGIKNIPNVCSTNVQTTVQEVSQEESRSTVEEVTPIEVKTKSTEVVKSSEKNMKNSYNNQVETPKKSKSISRDKSLLKIISVDELNKRVLPVQPQTESKSLLLNQTHSTVNILHNKNHSSQHVKREQNMTKIVTMASCHVPGPSSMDLDGADHNIHINKLMPQSIIRHQKPFHYALPTIGDNYNSKWFKLIIEHDFTEMQVPSKGPFTATYDYIDLAIKKANALNKTVRFVNHCDATKSTQPFGMYAVPKVDERCIFIGPYKEDEQPGIKTISRAIVQRTGNAKRTRGVWLYPRRINPSQEKNAPQKLQKDANCSVVKTDLSMNSNGEMSNKANISPSQISDDKATNFTVNLSNAITSISANQFAASTSPVANISKSDLNSKSEQQNVASPVGLIKLNDFLGKCESGKLKETVTIPSSSAKKTFCPKIKVKRLVTLFQNGKSLLKPVTVPQVYSKSSKEIVMKHIKSNKRSSLLKDISTENKDKCSDRKKIENVSLEPIDTIEIKSSDDEECDYDIRILKENSHVKSQKHSMNLSSDTIKELSSDSDTSINDKLDTLSKVYKNFVAKIQDSDERIPHKRDIKLEELPADKTPSKINVNNNIKSKSFCRLKNSQKTSEVYLISDRVKDLGYIKAFYHESSKLIQFSFPACQDVHLIQEENLCPELNKLLAKKIVFVPSELQLKWQIIKIPQLVTLWNPMKAEHVDGNHIMTNTSIVKVPLQERCEEIRKSFERLGSLILTEEELEKTEKWKLINLAKSFIEKLEKQNKTMAKEKSSLLVKVQQKKRIVRMLKKKALKVKKEREKEESPKSSEELELDCVNK